MRTGPKRRNPEERFWPKVDKRAPDECWPWMAGKTERYGTFSVFISKTTKIRWSMPAHRFAYECAKGPVPPGLVIDHLCGNRMCCNPAHLEAVTQGENARRWYAQQTKRTHCQRGHEFTPENTRMQRGGRLCKSCQRMNEANWRAKRRNADHPS